MLKVSEGSYYTILAVIITGYELVTRTLTLFNKITLSLSEKRVAAVLICKYCVICWYVEGLLRRPLSRKLVGDETDKGTYDDVSIDARGPRFWMAADLSSLRLIYHVHWLLDSWNNSVSPTVELDGSLSPRSVRRRLLANILRLSVKIQRDVYSALWCLYCFTDYIAGW